MRIIYLDQNKWIDLCRAVYRPAEYPRLRVVLELLCQKAKSRQIAVPLASANIYETHKISNPKRRYKLAYVQSTLSQGVVFRGRHKRLEVEVTDVLRKTYGLNVIQREKYWFLSNIFFESTLESSDPRHRRFFSERVLNAIRTDPPRFLFDYLTSTPDDIRTVAVSNFSKGAERLRQQVEERRSRDANESWSMRRRIQGAMLIINELDLILGFARRAGLPEFDENNVLRDNARKIINNSPTYFIEREIALRLEAQSRPIEENDFRDMQSFCAVTAYADVVVAENQFANLAKQSGLDRKYETQILTDLHDIVEYLR